MLRALANKLGVISFEARPCPCGNLMSPTRKCDCTKSKIEKHQSKIVTQEINVETQSPSARDLNSNLPQTSLQLMKKQIDQMKEWIKGKSEFESLKLDFASETLMRSAQSELNIDALAYQTIIKLARSIANLSGEANIQAVHIAEACNYRCLISR